MTVYVGSAKGDENGKASGGKAGDQKAEVATQKWYIHSKGWRVIRAKDPAKRKLIAEAMRDACNNKNIGYDQGQRNTLYTVAKAVQFNIKRVYTPCETDCSALVRVCCAYAGITLPDMYTGNQASIMLDSGAFVELTGSKYADSPDYLKAGDVLITKTKGHTVVVLDDGAKAEPDPAVPDIDEGNKGGETVTVELKVLRKGDKGEQVKTLQRLMMANGHKLPKYADDGDFGGETLDAVKAYQKAHGLAVDGIVGANTWKKLLGV